jgi:hypothetical protein
MVSGRRTESIGRPFCVLLQATVSDRVPRRDRSAQVSINDMAVDWKVTCLSQTLTVEYYMQS